MTGIFLKIVNMSISAGWIVLVVLLLRLLLKKAPKWITILLWGIVAVRLICPFSLESVLSLIPAAETISPEILVDRIPEIDTGISFVNDTLNSFIGESFAPEVGASANPVQIWLPVFAMIWIAGMLALSAYTLISYRRLHRKVATAVLLRDNIFQSEQVGSPFVLGIIRPRIYLPFCVSEQDIEHVIAHEKAHIRRKDHWLKPIGFFLLSLHWFNPLMWLGYVLLCQDIELACDEKVIKELNSEQKADYSQTLLTCSVSRRMISACPVAFGESDVRSRVRSVLNYRKPAFWIVIVAVIASITAAVCFLTNPKTPKDINGIYASSAEDPQILVNAGEKNPLGSDVDIYEVVANKSDKNVTLGIDVSEHQGTISWKKVAESGIDFAMIRIGYRTAASGEIMEDRQASYNMKEAYNRKIKVGVYFMSTAISQAEAVEEANWVADHIAGYHITYPVVYRCSAYDSSQSRQNGLSKTQRTNIALSFMQTIQERDYESMFYADGSELGAKAKWEISRIEKQHKVWITQYPNKPYPQVKAADYEGKCSMWQYTQKGTVQGINSLVNVNVAYFRYDEVKAVKDIEAAKVVEAEPEQRMYFQSVAEVVTAKEETNLRDKPSQGADSSVWYTLKNGEIAIRVGISDSGWSIVEFRGGRYYAVSSLLTTDVFPQTP